MNVECRRWWCSRYTETNIDIGIRQHKSYPSVHVLNVILKCQAECHPEFHPECHLECKDQWDMVRSHTVMDKSFRA